MKRISQRSSKPLFQVRVLAGAQNKVNNNSKNLIEKVPERILSVLKKIEDAGFESYLVGGCVRDLIIDNPLAGGPKDWDITTNAKPEDIVSLFEKTIYENKFGTVGVCLPNEALLNDVLSKEGVSRETTRKEEQNVSRETLIFDVSRETNDKYEIIEVTPYRLEAQYSDFRHPDSVSFGEKLEDDLSRRDFTINAMALNSKGHLTDIFGGLTDISKGHIKTVGVPDDRFQEDALRMMRAVRFACQLGFMISEETANSIFRNSHLIKNISKERIRDEFVKIILSKNASFGIVLLNKLNLLKEIIPELEEGIGCEQGGAHIYDVWNHLLQALNHAVLKDWPLEIRLSALFHDIGKPRTKRDGIKKPTFYGHEVVGARMAKKIMERLKFPKKQADLVEMFVRQHMFFSDTEQITLSPVRRIIAKVGQDHIWDLMKVRECDRVGMNKKEAPYRLRKYHAMVEEALRDPISVKQLKIDGNYLMKDMNMKPGPRMGWILNALLEEVLENPEKNEIEYLTKRVVELEKLPDQDLKSIGDKAKETKEELEEKEVEKLYQKHNV